MDDWGDVVDGRPMTPDWSKRTAVIMASGPSLTPSDCTLVGQSRVKSIAVNATFRRAPWADVVYMGDLAAIKTYNAEVAHISKAQRWTASPLSEYAGQWNRAFGLSMGGNSGHQAISLAAKFGARRILLLGFDMQLAPDRQRHWHSEHPKPCVTRSLFDEWIKKMGVLADELKSADVRVVNCSRVTALTCFRLGDLAIELSTLMPGA